MRKGKTGSEPSAFSRKIQHFPLEILLSGAGDFLRERGLIDGGNRRRCHRPPNVIRLIDSMVEFNETLCSLYGSKFDLNPCFSSSRSNHNCFVQQIKFDFNLFIVSAIRAQLPTPWQYNLENDKSQDRLDHKFGICPEIREINQPEWGTERNENIRTSMDARKKTSAVSSDDGCFPLRGNRMNDDPRVPDLIFPRPFRPSRHPCRRRLLHPDV